MIRLRHNTRGIASFLAVLLSMTMLVSNAQAEGLKFPQSGSDPISLTLQGSSASVSDPSEALAVFVGGGPCCEGRTPIAGRYAVDGGTLTFLPAFGFEVGQTYVARTGGAEARTFTTFGLSVDETIPPAEVTAMFPSGEALPENTLRFYIHFSVPMQPHVAFDYIKLRDADGTVDDAAFMRFKQELWNADRTRLTVLIDPGRIKREVATNVALGPALVAGQSYSLTVEEGWPSADGTSILPEFTKTFTVSDALRDLPDVALWQTSSPCIGTKEPLKIFLDRPFDRHLLDKDIRLETGEGVPITGKVLVGANERTWRFIPDIPWDHETLFIKPQMTLEDVAGNNFLDLLDHVQNAEVEGRGNQELRVRLTNCGNG